MADRGNRTIDTCTRILKRIAPELKAEEEREAANGLLAWLHCCNIEGELLQAEEGLDEASREYMQTYRTKLNNRVFLASAVQGPVDGPSSSNGSSPSEDDFHECDWIGPLDEWSSRLLETVIRPETSPTWEETSELTEEMGRLYSWDTFNVFKVTILTNGHPLEAVSMRVMKDLGLFEALNLDEVKFRNFVRAAELTYRPENKYHNNIHAADVTQSLAALLSYECMRSQLTNMEKMSVVVAAISHDIGHRGLNNDFLINSGAEEAKVYHDRSVNENMHLRYTFKLLEKEENNFCARLSREDYKFLRRTLINAILNTDMAVHTSVLAEFEGYIETNGTRLADWPQAHRAVALTLFVHCADIANPAKPGPFARCWAWRVMQEFYSQGDKEQELDLAVSPNCVRGKVNVPKSQLGFLQYCVRPTYEALCHLFSEITKPLDHIETGTAHWKSKIEAEARMPAHTRNGVDVPPAKAQKTV